MMISNRLPLQVILLWHQNSSYWTSSHSRHQDSSFELDGPASSHFQDFANPSGIPVVSDNLKRCYPATLAHGLTFFEPNSVNIVPVVARGTRREEVQNQPSRMAAPPSPSLPSPRPTLRECDLRPTTTRR